MESSAKIALYSDLRTIVDTRLTTGYCITIEDAGFNEEYLIEHWQSNITAFEFVEWVGNKYDLTPLTSHLTHGRSK
jgi:hypothetical protein